MNQNSKCKIRRYLFYIMLLPTFVLAQNNIITIKGKVSSDTTTLDGVTLQVKNYPERSASSDPEGKFTINAPADGTLIFSRIGYEPQEVSIDGRSVINIIMKPVNNTLADIVITGFGGEQKKASAISSITTIDVKELKGPTGNLTNTFAGRIPGMIAFQRSGEPGLGTDNSSFFIRGLSTFGSGKQDPLILIDGVESSPTDLARLQPDDIANFSVLKDAAASSVYGARGANGVVLINTKMGREGSAKYFFRSESRLSSNTKNFKLADNITYMRLANEAILTRSPLAKPFYSENKINQTIAGVDQYLYPSNDWMGQLIKDYTLNQSYNLNINGGTGKGTYYIAGTYNQDNGILNVDPLNNFNNNIKLLNYSLRSNISLKLTSSTNLNMRIYAQFDDYNGPIGGGARSFDNVLRANPVMFPALYPKDKLPYAEHPLFGSTRIPTASGGFGGLYTNPYAEMVKGYTVTKSSNINPQIELQQNLNFITPGLSARAMVYLRRIASQSSTRNYNPFFYESILNPLTQEYTLNILNSGLGVTVGTPGTDYLGFEQTAKSLDSRSWLEGTISYNNNIGKNNIGGSLISYVSHYELTDAADLITSLPQRNLGVSGRFSYGYDDRYLAEFNFGYNGSERFAKSRRFGFFPSAGIAYRISNERFFEPVKHVMNELKFRATYGFVGNDQIGEIEDRFFYLSSVNLNNGGFGASFGQGDGIPFFARPGVSINRYANENITWEVSRSINLGMDMTVLKDLNLVVEAYHQLRTNILQPKSTAESAAGFAAIPFANFGKAETKGVDFTIAYQKSFGRTGWINARGNFTYATSKLLVNDEISYVPSLAHLSRVNHSLAQAWGLIGERMFIDDAEVANSPVQFGDNRIKAGDLKYKDINNDGLINGDDLVPIGYPQQPEIIYGFGVSTGLKNFDFSFFFQGSGRSSFFINPASVQPYVLNGGLQNNLLEVIANDHWSEDRQNVYSFWPRLSDQVIASNNQVSTWWMRNGNFLRLKSLDLGYNIPNIKHLRIENARLYFSATNLFVWSNFKLWDVEMGGNGLGYPVQSVYSLGIQINF